MEPKRRKRIHHDDEPGHTHFLTFSCYRRLPLFTKERSCRCFVEAIDRARAKSLAKRALACTTARGPDVGAAAGVERMKVVAPGHGEAEYRIWVAQHFPGTGQKKNISFGMADRFASTPIGG